MAFFTAFFLIYYSVPKKFRYIVILIGSYAFYGFASIRMLLVLIAITAISYVGGAVIERNRRPLVYGLFFR